FDPEPVEAAVQVRRERRRGEPVRAHAWVGMSPLADEEQLAPVAPRGEPVPEESLRATELVRRGEVEGGASRGHQRVECPQLRVAPGTPGQRIGDDEAEARR